MAHWICSDGTEVEIFSLPTQAIMRAKKLRAEGRKVQTMKRQISACGFHILAHVLVIGPKEK